MNMREVIRLIKALRSEGWEGNSIDDLLLFIEGDVKEYMPRKDKPPKE